MSDDPKKKGAADRARVAAGQKHEVDYAAKKAGVTAGEARKAAKKVGPSRAKVEKELKR
jgi:hypothetical protein